MLSCSKLFLTIAWTCVPCQIMYLLMDYIYVISLMLLTYVALHWRHNDHDGVSNHQPHGCLLNRLFRRRSKKTSKLRVTGLCVGNSPVTGEFPAQRASYAENVSIWWRHHGLACQSDLRTHELQSYKKIHAFSHADYDTLYMSNNVQEKLLWIRHV